MREQPNRRRPRVPLAELALLVALGLAIGGLVSIDTSNGRWAMTGALVIGLLAGVEIGFRGR